MTSKLIPLNFLFSQILINYLACRDLNPLPPGSKSLCNHWAMTTSYCFVTCITTQFYNLFQDLWNKLLVYFTRVLKRYQKSLQMAAKRKHKKTMPLAPPKLLPKPNLLPSFWKQDNVFFDNCVSKPVRTTLWIVLKGIWPTSSDDAF